MLKLGRVSRYKMKNKIRHFVIRYFTNKLLHAVTSDDLLQQNHNGEWHIGAKKLKPEDIERLAEDAEMLERSLVWKLILNNIYWLALLKCSKQANNEYDTMFGKAMAYDIDIIEEFIEKLKMLRRIRSPR